MRKIILTICLIAISWLVNPASGQDNPVYQKIFGFNSDLAAIAPENPTAGRQSDAALVEGRDGNFYGVTRLGGATANGTIFRMSAAGVLTTLIEFNGANGSAPIAGLIQGIDGNFYGTTSAGGANGFGTVYMMTPAGKLRTLVSFSGHNGSAPMGNLAEGTDGNFYGTTSAGGGSDCGTVFKLSDISRTDATLQTLINFTGTGGSMPGRAPMAGLIQAGEDFYGTTSKGGRSNKGTVFRMTRNTTATAASLDTLVNFSGSGVSAKGAFPKASLILGSDGKFYGTTSAGGRLGKGTVFKLTLNNTSPTGATLKTLVEFTGNGSENAGGTPMAGVIEASDGSFYGTTSTGGASDNGTVFKITLNASPMLTTLVNFTYNGMTSKGAVPSASLIVGSDENFYSTTRFGGEFKNGTIFKMALDDSHTVPTLHTLVQFTGNSSRSEGTFPAASLVKDDDGTFYGTTSGGAADYGTLFKLTSDGILNTLVRFTGVQPTSGRTPTGGLIKGRGNDPEVAHVDGNKYFYGTTSAGGTKESHGTVFRTTINQMTGTVETKTLVAFSGEAGAFLGSDPLAGLIEDRNIPGCFYGTTSAGGAFGGGTVFKLTYNPITFKWELSTLVNFAVSGNDIAGSMPVTCLVQDLANSFYGTTLKGGTNDNGTVFKLTLDNSPTGATLKTLVRFTGIMGVKPGRAPSAALVKGRDGNFYGTTSAGGASDAGTVYKMTPSGMITLLTEFTGGNGGAPLGSLIEDKKISGCFYGNTSAGGTSQNGTIFKIAVNTSSSPQAWELLTLLNFTDTAEEHLGAAPTTGLALGSDGNFYGTTKSGGIFDTGTLFKVTPDGGLSTLVEFGTTSEGRAPSAGLIQDPTTKNFYGTTSVGGVSGKGTIFSMTSGGVVTTLINFTDDEAGNLGERPTVGLVQVGQSFYGVTIAGGKNGFGTIFKMNLDNNSATGATLETLINFTGKEGAFPGRAPIGSLVVGNDGNFYGTTSAGGLLDKGTVFRMAFDTTASPPEWKLKTLVEFSGNGKKNKGALPSAALVVGSDGNFYGTTRSGGTNAKGTVFKMVLDNNSATGANLETLISFTGSTGDFPGRAPMASLILEGDGTFYGTTSAGGALDKGTVFKLTFDSLSSPPWKLKPLVEFTGKNGAILGTAPFADLVSVGDGVFYGTTKAGGTFDYGTVFKLTLDSSLPTPQWDLKTLKSFALAEQGQPTAPLILGADGNLYGTSYGNGNGSDGCIYRLIFSGKPLVVAARATMQGTDSATVEVQVNPRGDATNVYVQYSDDPKAFRTNIPTPELIVTANLNDYQTKRVSTNLSGLKPHTVYYYRFSAKNRSGTVYSSRASFRTLSPPEVVIEPADLITPTSARFNGTVNAWNEPTTVFFEWGTDDNSFPNIAPAPTLTGNSVKPTSAAVAGLTQGVTYYYRLVATNAAGTVVSGTQMFTSLTRSIAVIGSANALSTTRAEVNGTVNPKGSSASVSFEYGTDGVSFPNSISSEPASVSGNDPVEVKATLTGLLQGTTYYYRIRATGPGGIGLSSSDTFSLSILSGLDQRFPDFPPTSVGSVTVNFGPAAEGGWRFIGETAWRSSGVAATHLESAPRLIEYLPLAGRISPPTEAIDVASGEDIVLNRIYFETTTTGSGSLTVRLKPDHLAAPDVPAATRAQWRFVGESQWRGSGGNPVSGLAAGTYLVECKPVTGRVTPPVAPVAIVGSDSGEITLTYFTANNTGAAAPQLLPFSSVATNEDLPFAYLGQIRTPVGSSTGFVVKRRVVATAGHVVFDDGTLTYISGIQWLFQRHAGEYEPKPQVPRGSYLAAGYAAQRVVDASPGEGSAESQTLDYAALYFLEEAGRGGYGGFLATDAGDDNEFLTSSASKILAGYPADAIPAEDEGKLHATAPFTAPLAPAFGETWTSLAVRGYGGMSGGPLFVQRSNGSYLPAAIYLGGNGQTVVRAINSSVVDLFLRAEVSGNGGDNNTGGGITHTSVTTFGSAADPGSIKVTILPAAATSAGRWGLVGESINRISGSISSGRSAGDYILQLAPVSGFEIPTLQTVRIDGGQLTEYTFTYVAANTAPTISNVTNKSTSRGTATAAIPFTVGDVETSPGSLTLTGKSGNLSLVPNSNIVFGGSGANRTVTITPAANRTGTATITLKVNDGSITTIDTFVLTVTAPVARDGLPIAMSGPSPGASSIAWESPESQGMREFVTTVELVDGRKYQALTVLKSPGDLDRKRTVEVSPNLLDWYSGVKHTTIVQDDDLLLKIRDNTPLTPGIKRYIRLKNN